MTRQLNGFLSKLPKQTRGIFLRRYWGLESVRDIAQTLGLSESKVKVTLYRTRKKLKAYLEQEGIVL